MNGQNINLIADWILIIIKKLNHVQHFHSSFIADMESIQNMVKLEEYEEDDKTNSLQMSSKHVQPFESSKRKRKKLSTEKQPKSKVSKEGEQSNITKWLQPTSRFQVRPIPPPKKKKINKKNGKLCKKEEKYLIGIQLITEGWIYACHRTNTECAQQIIQSRKKTKKSYPARKENMKQHKKDHIERTFQKHNIYPWNTFFRRPNRTCHHTGNSRPIHECQTCIELHHQSFGDCGGSPP